jgi:RNA polymerase sigma-70 factor (ECF subfamily)
MSDGNSHVSFSQAALQYLDALYGYAMILTRNQAEADDLVQETYLRAVPAFGRLLPDSNLKGWMFAIMRNAWLNQVRRSRNSPHFVELDAEEDYSHWVGRIPNDPYALFLKKRECEEVQAAVEGLPRAFREIIVLREIEGFSYQQIADILGCPAGTVMSRLGRAREKLRSVLVELQTIAPKTVGAKAI